MPFERKNEEALLSDVRTEVLNEEEAIEEMERLEKLEIPELVAEIQEIKEDFLLTRKEDVSGFKTTKQYYERVKRKVILNRKRQEKTNE